jgi:hypothetical protein
MTIRERLIGPCVDSTPDPKPVTVDTSTFVQRLVLFDTYILQSSHMLEMPALASLFGIQGLVTLLETRALRVQCDAIAMGQIGQTTFGEKRTAKGPLPLGSFSLGMIRAHDQESVVAGGLANVQKTAGSMKEVIRLKRAVLDALEQPPQGFGIEALRAMPSDLQNQSLVRAAIARGVTEALGRSVPVDQIVARVIQLDNDDFRIESNLRELLSISEADAHSALERAALAVGDVNYRMEQMKAHSALSGLIDDDISFFEYKLGILARGIDSKARESQFSRAIELGGFPQIDPGVTRIDVDKLLKARETPECGEFRQWLQTIGTVSDAEVRDRIAGLKAKLDTFVQSSSGKALRFLATTALGFVPNYGEIVGLAAGILDSFVVDKLFTASGPVLFLNRTYPSIFRDR